MAEGYALLIKKYTVRGRAHTVTVSNELIHRHSPESGYPTVVHPRRFENMRFARPYIELRILLLVFDDMPFQKAAHTGENAGLRFPRLEAGHCR